MSLLANVPTLSYISWKNMIITYNETTYQIENSHTNRMYIYWDVNNPYILTTSNKKLELRNGLFYLIFNESGKYTVIPNDDIVMNFSENPSRDFITSKIVGFRDETRGKFTSIEMDIDGIQFDVYDDEGKFSKFEQRVDKINLEVKGVEKKYSDNPQLVKMREDFNEVLLSLQATLGLFSSDMNAYMEDNSLSTNEKNNITSYKTSLEQKRVELNNQLNTVVEYLNGLEDIDQARIIEINASKDGLNTAISNLFTNIDAICSDNIFTNTEITAIVTYFGKTNLAINECKNTVDYVFLGVGGFLIEEASNITLEQDNIKLEVSKKVGKTEVISSINQTAESVKIQANKITLEGYVTVNQGFSIDTKGNMTAKNGTFTGGTIEIGTDANNYIKISNSVISSVVDGKTELTIDNGNVYFKDINNNAVGKIGRSTWKNTNIYLTSLSAEYGSTVSLSARYNPSDETYTSPFVVSSINQTINTMQYRQGLNLTTPDIIGRIYLRTSNNLSEYQGFIGYNSTGGALQLLANEMVYLGINRQDATGRALDVCYDSGQTNKGYIKIWTPTDFNNFPIYNANVQTSISASSIEPYTTNSNEGNTQLIYATYTGTDGELRYTERTTQHTMEEWDWVNGVYSPLGIYYCYCEIPSFMQENIEVDYHVNISRINYGEYRIIEKNQWLFIVESKEEGFAFTYEIVGKRKDTMDTIPKQAWTVWEENE